MLVVVVLSAVVGAGEERTVQEHVGFECPRTEYAEQLESLPGVMHAYKEAARAYEARRRSQERPKCVIMMHIHVPKTGGMSIRKELEDQLGPRAFFLRPPDFTPNLVHFLRNFRRGSPLVSSAFPVHTNVEHARGKLPLMPDFLEDLVRLRENRTDECVVRLFSVLRSPATQVMSAFHYDENIRHDRTFDNFTEYMNRAKACRSIDHQLSFFLGRWEESKSCRGFVDTRPEPAISLAWVLRTLGRFDHVGTTDDLATTLAWIRGHFQGPPGAPLGLQRDTPPRQYVNLGNYSKSLDDDENRRAACRLSEHDALLYRWALDVARYN